MSPGPTIRLHSGVEIPQLGLGVFQSAAGGETRRAVLEALRLGYRHIDTAAVYGNEEDVGAALRESGLPRDEIFVTTKLWNDDQGYDTTLRALDASLERLGLDHVDLYLIHWPVKAKRLASWRALEQIHANQQARAIGVSNFMPNHLEELLEHAQVVPSVNQVELSPFFQQRDVRDFCAQHQIVVEAYSPLTKGHRLDHPVIARVAGRLGRTPAQVLLRWGIEHGLVTLPKSVRPERIAENAAIFDFTLPPDVLAELDALEEGLATGWDPRDRP